MTSNNTPALSPAAAAAIAHFRDLGTQSMIVPEWGDLAIYWTPLTPFEKRRIFPAGRPVEQTVAIDVLIHKAVDKDGRKLFALADREELMRNSDHAVVGRIAEKILAGAAISDAALEEAEKN